MDGKYVHLFFVGVFCIFFFTDWVLLWGILKCGMFFCSDMLESEFVRRM